MNMKPLVIAEFPLSAHSARKVIEDLASNHTHRVLFSRHARERMTQRDITSQQVFSLLKSKASRFHEPPYQTERGDWKMNIEGVAAGSTIRLPLVIRRHADDPSILIVTVISI